MNPRGLAGGQGSRDAPLTLANRNASEMEKSRDRRIAALFTFLWLFVVFVSVMDGYLVLRHRNTILHFELNPFGRFLLVLNGGRVWYLLAAKFAGTVVACGVLLVVYWKNTVLGIIIASG